MTRGLRAPMALLAILFSLAIGAADPPVQEFSCEDYIGAWKGRAVADLVATWGEPTERKALSKGRVRVVYDLSGGTVEVESRLPLDKAFPAAKPTSGVPGEPEKEVIAPPGREAGVEISKTDDGTWKAASHGGPARLPDGPRAYVFEVEAGGTIVKVRCKD